MALSFLYIAFVRLLQLVRLSRGQQDLAIEVVMLRDEVAVLRRQVVRPALLLLDRAELARLSRLLSVARRRHCCLPPKTLLPWIEIWCAEDGPTRTDGLDDRRSRRAGSQ